MNHSMIRARAAEVLHATGLFRLPVDVDALAAKLELAVNYADLDDDYSGLLVIRDGAAMVHINAKHHPNRQRFSLAHELGHFVLHQEMKTTREGAYVDKAMRVYHRADRATGQDAKQEWEANLFAAELLMPEDLLRSKIVADGYDLEDESDVARLAVVLRVSEQALAIRLTRMGLLRAVFDDSAYSKL